MAKKTPLPRDKESLRYLLDRVDRYLEQNESIHVRQVQLHDELRKAAPNEGSREFSVRNIEQIQAEIRERLAALDATLGPALPYLDVPDEVLPGDQSLVASSLAGGDALHLMDLENRKRDRLLTLVRELQSAIFLNLSGEGCSQHPGESITELERHTPAFDRDDGNWVRNKIAADLENLKATTLSTYRRKGETNADKTLGRDQDGRVWRRPGKPNSHPWYLRSTLLSQKNCSK